MRQISNPEGSANLLIRRILRAPRGRSDGFRASPGTDSRGRIRVDSRKAPTPLRPDQIAQLLADRDAGLTLKHLAAKYRIARQTVIEHCKRAVTLPT